MCLMEIMGSECGMKHQHERININNIKLNGNIQKFLFKIN